MTLQIDPVAEMLHKQDVMQTFILWGCIMLGLLILMFILTMVWVYWHIRQDDIERDAVLDEVRWHHKNKHDGIS